MYKGFKYTRSRDFIANFISSFFDFDGARYLNPEKYYSILKQKYGKHTVYWDGIRRIYSNEIDKNDEPLLACTHPSLTSDDLSYINSQTKFRNLDSAASWTKIKKIYDEKKDQLTDATINISNSNNRISRLRQQIVELKTNIQNKEYCITEHENKISQLDTQRKNINHTIDAIKSDYDSIKSRYLEEVNSISADPEFSQKWISNLEASGIIIEDVWYYDLEDGTQVSIKENPKIPLDLLSQEDPAFKLNKIIFRTTKPVIIRVDYGRKGDDCKKVVGGPYICTITESSIYLKLATSQGCFGYNDGYGWIHPHTGYFGLNTNSPWAEFTSTLVNQRQSGCLGEASPLLYKAFQANDIKMAIFSAMTWISNANSTDTWGRNYKHFPTLSEVNIDGSYSEPEEETQPDITSEDGMNSVIEQMTMVIDDDLEDDDVEDDWDNDETWDDVEDPPEDTDQTENLRQPGVQGYRPYNS
jgi:hypothetical protein